MKTGRGTQQMDPQHLPAPDPPPARSSASAGSRSQCTSFPLERAMGADVLTVSNLGRTINGAYLHSGISFQVRSGEILFVTGPSGWVCSCCRGRVQLLRASLGPGQPPPAPCARSRPGADQPPCARRVGKTLLLRSLAYLDPFEEGSLTLNGQSPEELGVPK